MGAFIKHPKFWLPLAILLLLEGVFRLGAWEPLAEPNSYAGTSVALKEAIHEYGTHRVRGITVGDSRALFGIDHQRILEISERTNRPHLGLALPGSHMASLRAVSGWSERHMDDLDRIMIALAPGSLDRIGNGDYEIPVTEPFRGWSDYLDLSVHFPPTTGEPRSLGSVSSLMAYREDLAVFLRRPIKRWQAVQERGGQSLIRRLAFSNPRNNDLCEYDLSSVASCLAELQALRDSGQAQSPAARSFERYCRVRRAGNLPRRSDETTATWREWLKDIGSRNEVTFVLLPEHSLLDFDGYSEQLAADLLTPVADESRIRLINEAGIFKNAPEPECAFFSDLVHANRKGMQRLSDALIGELEF